MEPKNTTKQLRQIRNLADLRSHIANIEVELDDIQTTIGLLLGIDLQGNISESMADHGPTYAWLTMMSSQAEAAAKRTKHAAKVVYAEEDAIAREVLSDQGKYTEKMVEGEVLENSSRYAEALLKEIEAEEYAGMLKALSMAMYQRGELLQSIGANKRHEFDQQDIRTKYESIRKRREESSDD